MQELLYTTLGHVKSAWRFRWLAMGFAAALFLAGWVSIGLIPDRFVAESRVYVDTRSQIERALPGQIVESGLEQDLQFVRESLLGRPQLERLARASDLDLEVKDSEQMTQMVDRLRSAITIQLVPLTRARVPEAAGGIYSISFRHGDRETSIRVVRNLLDIFMEDTLGVQRTSSQVSASFLRDQIEEYQNRLREAEERLADFNREHAERLPGLQGGYFQRLQQEINELAVSKQQLNLVESKLASLLRQLQGGPEQNSMDGSSSATASLDTRIQELSRVVEDLGLRYTDRHPDVIAAREMLVQLQKQREELVGKIAAGSVSFASDNPVVQALQISKNEVQAEAATLRADVASRSERIEELRGLIDEMPMVEAQLAELTRDYDVINQQYQTLLASSERDKLTRDAQRSESVQFRVIDPPAAPLIPTDPNRLTLMGALLVLSLGAGCGLALLLSQLRPVFSDINNLATLTGFPVIGAVGRYTSVLEGYAVRRDLVRFSFSMTVLVIAFIVILAFEVYGIGLRGII
jgi:polysaccharide chain length determinant protein (PEP-CTERM system associated)